MKEHFDIPIVVIMFNRPELLTHVMDKIADVKPRQLFLVADGPRDNRDDDIEKCTQAREVALNCINWDCDVQTNFSESNMGLRKRVPTGVTWVFEQVEQAIILEDDCVPHISFFYFCKELLEKYKNDDRIMVMSGVNFNRKRTESKYSYYFSRYNHYTGWASWRRAWKHYDDSMQLWPELRADNWLMKIFQNKAVVRYWDNVFQQVYEGKMNSWGNKWTFACFVQSGLSITPNKNLVSHIGLGPESTNYKIKGFRKIQPPDPIEIPLQHPPFIIRDSEADNYVQSNYYGTGIYKRIKRLAARALVKAGIMK